MASLICFLLLAQNLLSSVPSAELPVNQVFNAGLFSFESALKVMCQGFFYA